MLDDFHLKLLLALRLVLTRAPFKSEYRDTRTHVPLMSLSQRAILRDPQTLKEGEQEEEASGSPP